jgi:ppGpp synthetase/RelA/SpoT-type nucleotidyltranferase
MSKSVDFQLSKGMIDRAGKTLISTGSTASFEHAFKVIQLWRFLHRDPLIKVRTELASLTKVRKALVVQRLKRLSSIRRKLKLQPTMMLSRMQDIGGCRAILPTTQDVRRVKEYYFRGLIPAAHIHKVNDYMDSSPKASGYRGVHLVYRSVNQSTECLKGVLIEIQLRTQLQHAWATAVETVDVLTKQALKSSMGDDRWKRFFFLMSVALAIREHTTLPLDSPSGLELRRELRSLTENLGILTILGRDQKVEVLSSENIPKAEQFYFILSLNAREKKTQLIPFKRSQYRDALEKYLLLERTTDNIPGVQVVLVSASSLNKLPYLKEAYPNYWLDVGLFVDVMNEEIDI